MEAALPHGTAALPLPGRGGRSGVEPWGIYVFHSGM